MTNTGLPPHLERIGRQLTAAAHDLSPAPRRSRPRAFRLAALRTTGLAAAATAAVFAIGATTATPPAFAVTRLHDGAVAVKINRKSGIAGAKIRAADRRSDVDLRKNVDGHVASPFGWKGAGECDTTGDPEAELALCLDALGRDEDPAFHRPAGHVKEPRVRPGESVVARLRADAHHQLAAAGDTDCHVAAQQEREASEHRLLGHSVLVGELLADSVREILVIGHTDTEGIAIELGVTGGDDSR
jgi:hypothetical protein